MDGIAVPAAYKTVVSKPKRIYMIATTNQECVYVLKRSINELIGHRSVLFTNVLECKSWNPRRQIPYCVNEENPRRQLPSTPICFHGERYSQLGM